MFAYVRTAKGADDFLIVLNLSGNEHRLELSLPLHSAEAEVALSSTLTRRGEVELGRLDLAANEGLVLRLTDRG